MTKPTCPYCGHPFEYNYCKDTWYDDCKDQYCESWYGNCEYCDTEYQWEEIFTKTAIKNLKEVEANE